MNVWISVIIVFLSFQLVSAAPKKLITSTVRIVTDKEEIASVKKDKKWESIFSLKTVVSTSERDEKPDDSVREKEQVFQKKKTINRVVVKEKSGESIRAGEDSVAEMIDASVVIAPDNEQPDNTPEKKEEKVVEKEIVPVIKKEAEGEKEKIEEKRINQKRLERAKEIRNDNAKRKIRDQKVNF